MPTPGHREGGDSKSPRDTRDEPADAGPHRPADRQPGQHQHDQDAAL
jgi:hypothetical protein